jgi:hypothetical protein
MMRKWFGVSALAVVAASGLSLSSCAHNTHLVSIAIQPGNGTFAAADPSLSFQYRAYGTYIHPPKTVDITDQVTWQSSAPHVATFTGPGVVSPNTNCGIAQIFATMHDGPSDIVSNQVSITVEGPQSLGCPQAGGATNNLLVDVTNGLDGVIVSSPGGILCGFTCGAQFTTGVIVILSATANQGHNFTGWQGCDTQSVTNCTVMMSGDRTVTASFD